MADSRDEALRDYLIGILEADGHDSAAQRLALRDAWHQRQTPTAAERPMEEAIPRAVDHQAAWSQLLACSDRTPAADDLDEINALKHSLWPDVRDAARQLEHVRRQGHAIAAIWPAELDPQLKPLFLQILSRPVTRTAELRAQLRQELQASSRSRRAFRRFAARFRREFRDLAACDPDLLTELLQPLRPIPVPRPKKVEPAKTTEWSMGTAAMVACGVVGGLISGLTSSNNRAKPPPPVRFQPPALHQPLPQPPEVNPALQDLLRQYQMSGDRSLLEEKRLHEAFFATRSQPDLSLHFLLDEEPADALQPANRAERGEPP